MNQVSYLCDMKSIYLFALFLLVGCQTSNKGQLQKAIASKADTILEQSINAHGGVLYETAYYRFTFRKKSYTFQHNNGQYTYIRSGLKDGKTIIDQVTNDKVVRLIDGKASTLTEKEINSIRYAVNSVIYFATLPHKLKDPAVTKKYIGVTSIKDKQYDILEVGFQAEGGGPDHDDVYHYWINQNTKLVDYLAYNFQVGKGGVRFRSAFNTRKIDGIIFQDYVNYKAPKGTPLLGLPEQFENNELEKLSIVAMEDVSKL